MEHIPYDASPTALFSPGSADNYFAFGGYADDAGLCAEMSRLAYFGRPANIDTKALSGYLSRVDFRLVGYVDASGQQAFLAARDTTLVLAFRGTEGTDWRDIWADIRFWPCDWRVDGRDAGRVHGGFARALDALWERLRPNLIAGDRRLLFTGHSLGGALATLAASRMHPAALFTFGCPRVGDHRFDAYMRSVVHARFVGCRDVVTRLPPPLFGFTHTGSHHYITHDGRVLVDPQRALVDADRQAAPAAFRRLHRNQSRALPIRDLCDHAPINYVSATLGRRA